MKIEILGRKALNVVLFEAMCELSKDRNLAEVFGIDANGYASHVDMQVNVTVNGITVPFAEELELAVNRMCDRIGAEFGRRVEDAAVKRITDSKLAGLLLEIEQADWRIRDLLSKAEIEL